MKSHDISITKDFLSEEMFRFSDIVQIQGENEGIADKNFLDGKRKRESITETDTEYSSVEYLINMHRIASNQTSLVPKIPNKINEKNTIIASGQGKKQFQF